MSVVSLTLTVTNPDEVLALYDSIAIYRSTTGEQGDYTLLTDAQTAVRLRTAVTSYSFNDFQGSAEYFYRSAYTNSVSGLSSPLSDPFGGGEDPLLNVLSVQELKDRYLFAIDLADKDGNPIPDSVFIGYIKSALAWVSSALDLVLVPTVVTNERRDYTAAYGQQYMWTNLSKRPVQSVQAVRLRVPGATPLVFPTEWIEVQPHTGVVEVVPQSNLTVNLSTTAISPFYSQQFLLSTRRRIPNAVEVDYLAGFPAGQVPFDILEVVGKQAAIGLLRIAGNILLAPGVGSQSIGIDGLSQSVQLTKGGSGAFAGMVSDFQQDIASSLPLLRTRYSGINLRTA